jgi:hypothetical protein
MTTDPGREPRRAASREIAYSAGREEGIGQLGDISISGALLSATTSKPPVESMLQVHVLRENAAPVDLPARVVRHSTNGFAVKFVEFTPVLAELLEEIEKGSG